MTDRSSNCRALTVLCAAPGRDRLTALKRAAVGAEWELVGGATTIEELAGQLQEWRPNIVVLDGLGPGAVARVREVLPTARVISLDDGDGADAVAGSLEEVRSAVLGIPPTSRARTL